MPKLVLKSDHSIEMTATKEVVWGTCAFHSVDSNGEPEFGGYTEIDWNSQLTVRKGGQRIFLDADGEEHLESDLELIPN